MATAEELVKPVTISGNEVLDDKHLGTLVTIEGCKYSNMIFLIGYIDPNIVKEEDKKSNWNRFFLDEEDKTNWGITSWAMSESCFKMHVENGDFDAAVMNDGVTIGERKHLIKPQPYTMNQFFEMPGLSGNRGTSRCAQADTQSGLIWIYLRLFSVGMQQLHSQVYLQSLRATDSLLSST